MPRRVSVEIVGDSASVERAFSRASLSARGFSQSTTIAERDFSKATRGILSGTGVFSTLGRSLAFASGGFLAFGGAAEAIRKSVDAAETSEKALRSLGAQAKASGASVKSVFASVGTLQAPAAQLGFNKADVEAGFTVLLRGSGSAKKALAEMAAAEDVARAKGDSLSQGATIVNRALISTGNSARALGIHFPKAATEAQKLALILQRFSGQARANTTEQDRFNATLFNTEAIIGTTLLPTLNKYLAELGNWLTKMDQSGRLQRDVSAAVSDTSAVLRGIGGVIKTVDGVTGSFKNTLHDLADVWLLLKVRTLALRWGVIEGGIAGVGGAATLASAEVGGLSAALGRLSKIGPIAIAIGLELIPRAKSSTGSDALSNTTAGRSLSRIPILGPLNSQLIRLGDAFNRAVGLEKGKSAVVQPIQTGKNNPFEPGGALNSLTQALKKQASGTGSAATRARRSLGLQGQFNLDELKLAQARAAGNTADQKQILTAEAVILKSLAAQAKTLKSRTAITQQLVTVEDQLRSLNTKALSTAKSDASKAVSAIHKDELLAKARLDLSQSDVAAGDALLVKDRARLKAELAQAKTSDLRLAITNQLTTVQSLLKAKLAQFSIPLKLQLAQAKADANAPLGAQGLTEQQVNILRAEKAAAEKALSSGKLAVQAQIAAYNAITGINQQLAGSATAALGSFREANTKQLTAGLGLSAAAIKALRGRLSQLGPGGHIPDTGVGAFGSIIGPSGTVVVPVTINMDGKKVAKSVTNHQIKRQRRNSSQSRGPFAGSPT